MFDKIKVVIIKKIGISPIEIFLEYKNKELNIPKIDDIKIKIKYCVFFFYCKNFISFAF